MKKTIACFMLCALCMIFTVSTSNRAYAHEEIPTYYGPGGGGRSAGGEGADPVVILGICKIIGEACAAWGVCIFLDGLLACVSEGPEDPDNPVLTEMPICECTNGHDCFQECKCGFRSGNRGPVIFGTHRCGSQQQ